MSEHEFIHGGEGAHMIEDDLLEEENLSLAAEFVLFLRENKKWWLIPLIALVLALGLIALAASKATVLSPFIYSFM